MGLMTDSFMCGSLLSHTRLTSCRYIRLLSNQLKICDSGTSTFTSLFVVVSILSSLDMIVFCHFCTKLYCIIIIIYRDMLIIILVILYTKNQANKLVKNWQLDNSLVRNSQSCPLLLPLYIAEDQYCLMHLPHDCFWKCIHINLLSTEMLQ